MATIKYQSVPEEKKSKNIWGMFTLNLRETESEMPPIWNYFVMLTQALSKWIQSHCFIITRAEKSEIVNCEHSFKIEVTFFSLMPEDVPSTTMSVHAWCKQSTMSYTYQLSRGL